MQDDVVALFAYDRWANRKVLDACRKLTAEQYVAEPVPGWSSVRSTIYHIALATDFGKVGQQVIQAGRIELESAVADAAARGQHETRRRKPPRVGHVDAAVGDADGDRATAVR